MKKILALLLALVLTLGLFACGAAPLEETNPSESWAETTAPAQELPEATEPEETLPIETEPIETEPVETEPEETEAHLDPDGWYYSAEDVALYLVTYGELPSNFITKNEARDLGWEGGSVQRYLEGAAIGGDKFGNREGILPKADGRQYYECDIDTDGASSRGAKRIVFSNDGLIYYTEDHYESFILLYGEE
ncbi:MAG: ribonuclease [Oscillospiraceae bacterium]|nr:ribonuclease [Oscillospiraceae bacterium]